MDHDNIQDKFVSEQLSLIFILACCSKVHSTDKIYNEVKDSEKHNQLKKYCNFLVTSLNDCSEDREVPFIPLSMVKAIVVLLQPYSQPDLAKPQCC